MNAIARSRRGDELIHPARVTYESYASAPSLRRKANSKLIRCAGAILLSLILWPAPAAAASLDGASLSIGWAVPFIGILLCIATGPVFYPHIWEHHYGKFTTFSKPCP